MNGHSEEAIQLGQFAGAQAEIPGSACSLGMPIPTPWKTVGRSFAI